MNIARIKATYQLASRGIDRGEDVCFSRGVQGSHPSEATMEDGVIIRTVCYK